MSRPSRVMKAGTRAGFVPMNDVTQFWEKPNKLVVLNDAKVKRILVFGFGHLNDKTCMANIGRKVLSELPERFPKLYPPWKPCRVGTYDSLVSHGARVTLLQSPPGIRSQHLGPWAIKSMRGVIQGFIDGKRKKIPGTVRDLFGDVDGVSDLQLAPLDTALDLTKGLESLGIGHQEGVQAGLLDPREVAVVVLHEDYMLPPGVVQVPAWLRNHHEGFNGVVTSFRKGFLTGVRGARIAIGVGWPGYEKGEPKPFKPELVPKLWPLKRDFSPEIVDRSVEAVEDQLRSLQIRWKIAGAAELRNKWQTMPISKAEEAINVTRVERQAELAKEAMTKIAEARKVLEEAEAQRAVERRRLVKEARKNAEALQEATNGMPSEEAVAELKKQRRAAMRTFKKENTAITRRAERTIKRAERLLAGVEPTIPLTTANTADRLLGQSKTTRKERAEKMRAAKNKDTKDMRDDLAADDDLDDDDWSDLSDAEDEEDVWSDLSDDEDVDFEDKEDVEEVKPAKQAKQAIEGKGGKKWEKKGQNFNKDGFSNKFSNAHN